MDQTYTQHTQNRCTAQDTYTQHKTTQDNPRHWCATQDTDAQDKTLVCSTRQDNTRHWCAAQDTDAHHTDAQHTDVYTPMSWRPRRYRYVL